MPPATPQSVPPATPPAAPPTPLPARPSAPPVNGPDAGQPRPRRAGRAPGTPNASAAKARAAGTAAATAAKARTAGTAAAASKALAGAGKVASDKASQLGGWVRRQSSARIGAAVAAVVVMGLLIWGVTSLGGSPKQPAADVAPAAAAATSAAPASRGPLPLEGVGPLDFQPGDCFKDFDPEAPQSTIVDCATGHSAQLIAVHHYPASEAYPGLDALKDKGRETCRSAQLAAAATTYNLLQRNAYPSSSSWNNGDRRVDCYVTADAGNVIMESLVP